MSRAHVRRTIHDKRESFRLKERERGRVFRGREGADDLTNCSRNESSRLALPCAASCVFSSDVSLSRVDHRYMCIYMYVCTQGPANSMHVPVIWIGLSNCVQPWPRTNSYLVRKQNHVHSICVIYPALWLEARLCSSARESIRRCSCLVSFDTVSSMRFVDKRNVCGLTGEMNSNGFVMMLKKWRCYTFYLISIVSLLPSFFSQLKVL